MAHGNTIYQSTRRKNPTPDQVMHDIKHIAAKNHVYVKGADVETEYFWECCERVRKQSYYYGMRLEQLAFRYLRAKRNFAQMKKVA